MVENGGFRVVMGVQFAEEEEPVSGVLNFSPVNWSFKPDRFFMLHARACQFPRCCARFNFSSSFVQLVLKFDDFSFQNVFKTMLTCLKMPLLEKFETQPLFTPIFDQS